MNTIALICVAAFANAQPIPANGSFDAGTRDWGLSQQEGATADFTAVASDSPDGGLAARLEVTNQGLIQHLQLMHGFPTADLTVGDAYELRFFARSDDANTLSVRVFNRDRPWSSVGLGADANLTNEWREFRFPFRATQTPQDQSKVDFFLGTATGVIWIDGVEILPFTREVIQGTILIESDDWSATFTEQGALARFVQTPGDVDLAMAAAGDPIYQITLVGDAGERALTVQDGPDVSVAEREDGGREFRYDHGDVILTCTVAPREDGLLAFAASASASGEEAITAIRYPILRAPIQLGDGPDDDAILLPAFDGGICEAPKLSLAARGGGFTALYPGPASCQLMAYYQPTSGLYMAAYDPDGYPKRFSILSDVDLTFAFDHYFPRVAGEDAELTYPVVIGTCGGTWHDAAEIYRDWAHQQAWCETPLTEKTPDWLARGALVTNFDPRNYKDLTRLHARLGRFVDLYATPLIPNSRGWERWGTWTGQEYLPPLPSEEHFDASAQIIREHDGRGMVMLSGYRWTIEKKQGDDSVYSSQERFDREVAPNAVCDSAGEPIVRTSTKENDWHGQKWAMLCRATDFAKDTIVDISEYCVRHDYPVIHFDQEVSGSYANGVCGSAEHGHPPGDGRYVHLALEDLYKRIRERCEPLSDDFVLSMEEPNELYLPYLNLCQCRPFGLTTEWPATPPMTRSVPLFSYLYHDRLIQWAAFYPWKSGGHPEVSAAKGFAAGLMPGLHPYDYSLPEEGTTRYSEFFRTCMDLYLGDARECLIFGEMQSPLDVEIPDRTIRLGKNETELTVPAVYHSTWRLPNASGVEAGGAGGAGQAGFREATVFFNPTDESFTLSLPTGPLTLDPWSANLTELAP